MILSNTYCKILKILLLLWETDVPLKVFGIIPEQLERNRLWRLLFAMYECSSIYRYGRVELNLFISEKEFTVCARHFAGNEGVMLYRIQTHLYCIPNVFARDFFPTRIFKYCQFSTCLLYAVRTLLRNILLSFNCRS